MSTAVTPLCATQCSTLLPACLLPLAFSRPEPAYMPHSAPELAEQSRFPPFHIFDDTAGMARWPTACIYLPTPAAILHLFCRIEISIFAYASSYASYLPSPGAASQLRQRAPAPIASLSYGMPPQGARWRHFCQGAGCMSMMRCYRFTLARREY